MSVHTVQYRLATEGECTGVGIANCSNNCIASHSQLAFTAANGLQVQRLLAICLPRLEYWPVLQGKILMFTRRKS